MNRKEKQAKQAIDRLLASRNWEPPDDAAMLTREERGIIDMLPSKPRHSMGYYARAACLVVGGLILCAALSFFCVPSVRAWVSEIASSFAAPYDGALSVAPIPGYEATPMTDNAAMYQKGDISVIVSIEYETVNSRHWLDSATESFYVDGAKITKDFITVYEKDGCYMTVVFTEGKQLWISMYNGGADDFAAVLRSLVIK